ncbi:MAG: hypothetical protein ABSA01_15310 [Anaerolineales bacterium]|jgi:hypothetical protein
MDNFELKPESKEKQNPVNLKIPTIWNILTVLVLLGSCVLAYFFLTIYQNPAVLPSSLLPAAIPTAYHTPTPTATIILQPPTWTPTSTLQPSPTRTKAPTWTSVAALITPTITITPAATPVVTVASTGTALPVVTAANTGTAMPGASYVITRQASTTTHPDLACNWMGIGGTVMDVNNKPLQFQTIQVGGTLAGKAVTGQVLSGNNPVYGTSGFELKLADSAIDSTQTLWVQLFDNNGKALTDKIYFDTFNDCQKNLVMIVYKLSR